MTKLFEPIKIGQHTLEHRVVLAPLTRVRATTEGVPTDIMVEHYGQRASKGGLLIAEAVYINPTSRGYSTGPGIYTKQHIEGWKKVTDAVHEKEGIIFLQVWHAGRAGFSKLSPNKEPVVSSSAVAIKGKNSEGNDYEKPRALEIDEIKEIVQDFKQSALKAMEAGFDGVEIHSANGYLLDQFINSSTNQRTDEYGGSVENRTRFALEVVDAVVEAVGPERTAIRFSPGGSFQDMYDEDPLKTWGYVTEALQKKHPRLAYLHFIEPRSSFANDNENTVDSLQYFRGLWKGPFVNAGGYSNSVEHAVKLAEDTDGLVAFGRAFIANPDLPERIKHNYPFNKYDRSTFYTQGSVGYNDYSLYNEGIDSQM